MHRDGAAWYKLTPVAVRHRILASDINDEEYLHHQMKIIECLNPSALYILLESSFIIRCPDFF